MTPTSPYRHTQHAPLHFILYIVVFGEWVGAVFCWPFWQVSLTLAVVGLIIWVLSFSFQHLTISDEEDHLLLQFGPLVLFRKRIAYADITAAEVGRSKWIDGWGIHYTIGRGWTYNLWGYDCVVLSFGKKTIRLGTDDPKGLAEMIQARTA